MQVTLLLKKIEAVQEDLATLYTKIDSIEEQLKNNIENNGDKIDDEKLESLKIHKDQSKKLEILLEDNSRNLDEVEANLLNPKDVINKVETLFTCEECDETFRNKQNRRKHIMKYHPKYIKCDYCDETFNES